MLLGDGLGKGCAIFPVGLVRSLVGGLVVACHRAMLAFCLMMMLLSNC